jgi:hypothetical protein
LSATGVHEIVANAGAELKGLIMKASVVIAIVLFANLPQALAADSQAFRTPSNNIHCSGYEADNAYVVECEIIDRSNQKTAQPRPSDCDLEWGSRFSVAQSGRAYMGCTGDTIRDPNGRKLSYGKSITLTTITCTSNTKGLECVNEDGHGFFVSKSKQRLF